MEKQKVSVSGGSQKLAVQSAYGLHLTLDGYGCSKEKLADMNVVFNALDTLPSVIGMHKIITPYVIPYDCREKPEDSGVSGFVMIAESHMSIHTYPEKGYITADVYSCKHFDVDKTVAFLVKAFGIREMERNEVVRGLKFPKSS